jgi:hypothetical protein
MLRLSDFDVQRVHHEDLLRQAERDRLARQALVHRQPQRRIHGRVLSWLGRRLVAWGAHLQKRYSAGVGSFAVPIDKPQPGAAA